MGNRPILHLRKPSKRKGKLFVAKPERIRSRKPVDLVNQVFDDLVDITEFEGLKVWPVKEKSDGK